eukprot:CAMPEP_0168785232 /NCGR_PEP_ID=MMETSP0725-20121227/10639_1 /TAXON_ID=265536 /ORGANISM="Amphiprora sp., Strain CCMP467" /LENGTH=43 /DNA_ID= /DNA_START= /DNA_END= /DNA_ORIENTATION=
MAKSAKEKSNEGRAAPEQQGCNELSEWDDEKDPKAWGGKELLW